MLLKNRQFVIISASTRKSTANAGGLLDDVAVFNGAWAILLTTGIQGNISHFIEVSKIVKKQHLVGRLRLTRWIDK